MRTPTLLATILAVLLMAGAAPIPATAPDAPTTPEAFTRRYTAAVETRDRDALMKLYACETDAHRATAKAMIDVDLLAQELASNIRERLGIPLVHGGYFYSPGAAVAWDIGPARATIKPPQKSDDMPRLARLDPSEAQYPNLIVKHGELRVEVDVVRNAAERCTATASRIRTAMEQVKTDQCRSLRDVAAWGLGNEPFLQPDRAVAVKPTTFPATRPITIDLSSPLEAYRSYARAVRDADADAYLRIVLCEAEQDRAYEATFVRWIQSANNLWRAAADRYGAEDADMGFSTTFFPDPHVTAINALRDVQEYGLTIKGDEAEVEIAEMGSGHLALVEGKWRVLSWPRGHKRDHPDREWTRVNGTIAKIADDTAARIRAGDFPTARAAFDSMGLKLAELTPP